MICHGCASPIPETAPLFVDHSTTHFESIEGCSVPFHFGCCSDECLEAVERREREAWKRVAPMAYRPFEAVLVRHPAAFSRPATHAHFTPPQSLAPKGNRAKRGFPEPRMKWDQKPRN